MKRPLLEFLGAVALLISSIAAAQQMTLNIESQPMPKALAALAAQTGMQLIFPSGEVAKDLQAPAVSGRYTPQAALKILLANSGLQEEWINDRTVAIRITQAEKASALRTEEELKLAQTNRQAEAMQKVADSPNSGQQNSRAVAGTPEDKAHQGEIVVTGTNIRGVKDLAAPTIVITREEIERTGFSTTEDVFTSLPQNFAGIGSRGAGGLALGLGSEDRNLGLGGTNNDHAAGVDLRGLGAEVTLTLLNGTRRAGSIGGRVVDVSAIPLSAVERVEIVTGGRSAIYGSDAVGGVVNIVTRRDFEGTEAEAYYGGAAAGGEQLKMSLISGKKFQRGGFVASYDYGRDELFNIVDTGLTTSRSIGTPLRITLQPEGTRHSAFLSGRFFVSDRLELHADGLYTRKEFDEFNTLAPIPPYTGPNSTDTWRDASASASRDFNVSVGGRLQLGNAWSANFSGAHSRATLSQGISSILYVFGTTRQSSYQLDKDSRLDFASAVADGPLPAIGAITPHAAIGAERRKEDVYDRARGNGSDFIRDIDRTIESVFAELVVPVIERGSRPGLRRVEVSAAVRYDDYSDFGDTINPQYGLIWEPAEGVKLRTSYSTAFRAPALYDLAVANPISNSFVIVTAPDPMAGGVNVPLLSVSGVNPNLGPEEATTWSVGMDYEPAFAPGTRLAASYFDVDFTGRIGSPNSGFTAAQTLQREYQLANLINRHPTAADLQSILNSSRFVQNTTGISWLPDPNLPSDQGLLAAMPNLVVFSGFTNNIAVEKVRGLDLAFDAKSDTRIGELTYGLNATKTLDHMRRITATSPDFSLLNEVNRPVDFRFRANMGWNRGPWGAFVYVNYTDSYANPLTTPFSTVVFWITADLTVNWDSSKIMRDGLLSGIRASLSVNNLFDNDPPEVRNTLTGKNYDATNASPIGRYISLRLNKRW